MIEFHEYLSACFLIVTGQCSNTGTFFCDKNKLSKKLNKLSKSCITKSLGAGIFEVMK